MVAMWNSLSESARKRQLVETRAVVHQNLIKAAQGLQKQRKKQQDWPQLQPLTPVLIRDDNGHYKKQGVIAVAYTTATYGVDISLCFACL